MPVPSTRYFVAQIIPAHERSDAVLHFAPVRGVLYNPETGRAIDTIRAFPTAKAAKAAADVCAMPGGEFRVVVKRGDIWPKEA